MKIPGNDSLQKAFTLIEILVAVLILSMAALPLIMLSRSDNFQTSFNDAYMIALSRAKRISSAFDAMGYNEIVSVSGVSSPGSEGTVNSPLPQPEEELRGLAQRNPEMTYLKHIENKMKNLKSTIQVNMPEEGILSVRTTITWTIPGENNKLKEHSCTIVTFLTNSAMISSYGADN